jgi:putative toxin-antitoxin system antitoxin component (TIGR02293 family)
MAPANLLQDILGISGLDQPSAIDNAQVVRAGLSIESFKRVAGYYQLTDAQMSKVVGTSVRTIVRLQKEHKPLNATWSDRLYRLARVAAQAQDVLESSETATSWLKRPNRALEGNAPIDLLDTDAGTEQVMELLGRIEYGVYS